MKVNIEFDVETLEDLDKITQEVEKIIPDYKVKMEFDSDELKDENGD
jgi:predicted RNA binding protein with dsRBD fold (UPF0201 family)